MALWGRRSRDGRQTEPERPQEESDAAQEESDTAQATDPRHPAGKGRPTPRRKDAEAANRRPLIASDRKEAKRADRERREKERALMLAGDERYLPKADQGPQRRWVRAYVDARWNVGEFMLPLMVVILLLSLVPIPAVQTVYTLLVFGFIAVLVIDCWWLGRSVRKRLAEKHGPEHVEKGVAMYAVMRAAQMRPMRVPKPQRRRGDRSGI